MRVSRRCVVAPGARASADIQERELAVSCADLTAGALQLELGRPSHEAPAAGTLHAIGHRRGRRLERVPPGCRDLPALQSVMPPSSSRTRQAWSSPAVWHGRSGEPLDLRQPGGLHPSRRAHRSLPARRRSASCRRQRQQRGQRRGLRHRPFADPVRDTVPPSCAGCEANRLAGRRRSQPGSPCQLLGREDLGDEQRGFELSRARGERAAAVGEPARTRPRIVVFASNTPTNTGIPRGAAAVIGHGVPDRVPDERSPGSVQKAENPATMPAFRMARPGLEPGTPRFSGSRCATGSRAKDLQIRRS